MKNRNLHCHTWRCKHAEGDIEDLCIEAIKNGIQILGISEHAPQVDHRWSSTHMDLQELDSYCQAFLKAKEKFKGQLRLYLGLECEYRPEHLSFFREELYGRLGFDYLAAGSHWYPDPQQRHWPCSFYDIETARDMRLYTDYTIAAIQSGLFQFYTHPDIFAYNYFVWDEHTKSCCRAIIEAANDSKVALEINGLGLRRGNVMTPQGSRPPYPYIPFWEIAAEYPQLRVICNSDAHRPQDVAAGIDLAEKIAIQFKLQETDLFV